MSFSRNGHREERWYGIERHMTRTSVLRLRGSVAGEHTLARLGAERLWSLLARARRTSPRSARSPAARPCRWCGPGSRRSTSPAGRSPRTRTSPGRPTPTRASTRPTACPASCAGINNALLRADQIDVRRGRRTGPHWLAPIVADAEAGFGGPLNAFELMKAMIEAGAAGVHCEDQLASEKKCGHLGGKVLVPDAASSSGRSTAARLAADVLDVPTVLVARTDALQRRCSRATSTRATGRSSPASGRPRASSASATGSSRDRPRRSRTRPYADLLWFETSTPDLGEAREFAEAIHERHPGKLLAYNCSPSFNWARHLDDDEIATFQRGARRAGLPLPVHHPRRLPRAERVDVRARAAATRARA